MSDLYVPSPIDFVKEIAMEFECSGGGDELAIISALYVMNKAIRPIESVDQAIVKAAEAYELPADDPDVEMLTDEDIRCARILDIMVRGKINCVQWFGSTCLSGFGLRMFGVDFYHPDRQVADVLFVPVETIDVHLAA